MSGYELSVERDFDAPPAAVFDALLGIYAEPLPDWIASSSLDLRVGGAWDIAFQPPGVAPFAEHRVFSVVDRPRRLAYTATISGESSFDTTVDIAIDEQDGGSRMSLTQQGFPRSELRDEFAGAWPDVLALVAARL